MKIAFKKFHGAGNDFILIDNRDASIILDNKQIAILCHRHYGIGADGLIFLDSDSVYDFGMRYYNSDGQLASMCGNGARCVVAFASSLALFQNSTTFVTTDGLHTADIEMSADNQWSVSVSIADSVRPISYTDGFFVNTGVPHFVVFVEKNADIDVNVLGRALRNDSRFAPEGVNVNFVEVVESGLSIRTYERGIEGETLACGTGATAAALAFASKEQLSSGVIPVRALGGDLAVSFTSEPSKFSMLRLVGPVEAVFEGTIVL